MNPSIAYGLTVLAALCIPAGLVLVPTTQAAGLAAVLLLGLAEVWRRALRRRCEAAQLRTIQAIREAVDGPRPRQEVHVPFVSAQD